MARAIAKHYGTAIMTLNDMEGLVRGSELSIWKCGSLPSVSRTRRNESRVESLPQQPRLFAHVTASALMTNASRHNA